jgi:voltage-gated potassium channel
MRSADMASAGPHETRFERRLDRAVARATTPRGAAVVIAVASIAVTVGSAIVMTVADRKTYPTIGSALWWAIQTTTTVGYGDNVPVSTAGRVIAAFVMLFGIGFLTVITAAITSTFVSRSRMDSDSETAAPTAEQFRHLDERLERIEVGVSGSSIPDNDLSSAEQLRQIDARLEQIEAAVSRRS